MSGAMRQKTQVLTAVAAATPILVGDLENVTLQFLGTFATDSITIETSNEPGESTAVSNWETVGTAITAVGIETPTGLGKWLRLDKTAGSNAITVHISGTIKIR